jgi:lysozyme
MISEDLIRQIKEQETFSSTVYRCSEGHNTIGFGRNLDANPNYGGKPIPIPLSKELAEEIMLYDLRKAHESLIDRCPAYADEMPGPRRDVLLNMAYNMGVDEFLDLKKILDAFAVQNFELAAKEMYNSRWHRQVKSRAAELETQMRTGRYSFYKSMARK